MNDTLKLIQINSTPSALRIRETLLACLHALQQTGSHEAEIEMAQTAVAELGPIITAEREPLLLGRLYQLGYETEYDLFRVTCQDFASVLLEFLDERNQTLEALTQDELDNLVIEATDYLNSEGLDWRMAVWQSIQNGWPKHPATHPEKT